MLAPQPSRGASLKFLRIIGTADPKSGGPIEGFFRSAEILRELGHSSTLVTLDSPSDPWVAKCPVPVVATGGSKDKNRTRRWLPWVRYGYNGNIVPWLKHHSNQFDVIIVSGLWNYCALA